MLFKKSVIRLIISYINLSLASQTKCEANDKKQQISSFSNIIKILKLPYLEYPSTISSTKNKSIS